MIVVTGGAGFIGSAIVWALNLRGYNEILIVDLLDKSKKWENLACLKFSDSIDKDEFIEKLYQGKFCDKIDAVIHMGAESSTTVYETDYLMKNNYEYTKKLAMWCIKNDKRFVYASSAATYGNGDEGFCDEHLQLEKLRPLNPYADSKHLFDLWAYRQGLLEKIAGLKFFNCFGPNEYHKESMKSMVLQAFEQIKKNGKVKLFKSFNTQYKDGEQLRDFIYVKDAADMTLFIFENKKVNGIFNIGTGKAQSFNELVNSVFGAMGKDSNIAYIDMLESIKDKYQYFTQADMGKLKDAGYIKKTHTLKEAVYDYVKNYLLKDNSYLKINNISFS
ncbi:MAG: ADP-glyceromanno-heptose 6-epimerase [Candidatus Omnitrophica bacterium]|nr:ADP-glyceromanno-heptose 6-epimerase [Candidatus Omnitrophota bacterium]MBU1047760.1 ADP-glyceromanno-heptose 6-epimerase [Candidatus Omnitrophota bacterium]MBU1631071.1 ADP-glyceromanno-heptose 6-epimerase [Candidatus Omnitrophota bacterium]MBU1766619.1 ADP-glyceromanno-heptose 6-epimerase [Candidatus Omnitrophota bacterium]MBU1889339.1 ADP-glyceromanno-heptose 6-epimerase [Candidatus Omnitrophota bacterium]